MSKCFKTATTLGLVALLVAPAIAATTTKKATKPAAKPAAKPVAKPAAKPHIVQGTKQWSGENADLGITYTIDKAINFKLNILEYSVEPLGFGGEEPSTVVANGDQKLLVLHFTLHNPKPEEQRVLWATVRFTVVDQKNTNHEGTDLIGVEKDKTKLWVDLKPGQKIDCYSAVIIPADAIVTKLIVKGSQPELGVLRYYKEKMKIKPLVAPFADPKDKTGTCALSEVPSQMGVFYPMKNLAVRVDEVSYTSEQINSEAELPEDSRYFVCNITYKNVSAEEMNVGWGEFSESKLTTDQDEEMSFEYYLLPKAKRKAEYVEVKPGQEKSVRLVFVIPNDSKGQTLTLREGEDSRAYIFDVSGTE